MNNCFKNKKWSICLKNKKLKRVKITKTISNLIRCKRFMMNTTKMEINKYDLNDEIKLSKELTYTLRTLHLL